ncbi:MAG: hypothetical protein ACM3TN_26480 [Alphaproteobacteria bacterium]
MVIEREKSESREQHDFAYHHQNQISSTGVQCLLVTTMHHQAGGGKTHQGKVHIEARDVVGDDQDKITGHS